MKINYLNMIQIVNFILINVINIQQKEEQILQYMIEKKNIIIKIYLYVKKIANIMDFLKIIKKLPVNAKLKLK